MLIRISDDNSIILESVIWANIEKGLNDVCPLSISLKDGHLFIISSDGKKLKVKRYKRAAGKFVSQRKEKTIKRKPVEFEGLCIDLNLDKNANIKKKEK